MVNRAALSGSLAFRRDRTAVQLDQAFGNGESEPESAVIGISRSLDLAKWLKNPG